MATYNKNIAAVIIIFCLIAVIIGVFIPKQKEEIKVAQTNYEKSSGFSVKPYFSYSPFRGERISVVKLEGVIADSTGSPLFRDLTSSSYVLDLIIKATKDPSIKAIVLRINSPGGTVAASQELYQAVMKARKKKPVVVTMGDVAASGGYYIASAADAIFANPGTLTGSIGVITQYLNFADLLTKIGVKGVVIKSGQFKDIGNPTRPLTEEERKILQTLLDNTYKQFIKDVAKGRKTSKENIEKIAKGLIYTGEQAKKAGLVDYIGDYYLALKHAQKLAKKRFPEIERKFGKRDLPIEESWKGASLIDLLTGITNKFLNNSLLENKLLNNVSYSKFQPLWLLD